MRLDHLLSKETVETEEVSIEFLGQTFSAEIELTLFNLEGTHLSCERKVSPSARPKDQPSKLNI